jgi:hypothetical protein
MVFENEQNQFLVAQWIELFLEHISKTTSEKNDLLAAETFVQIMEDSQSIITTFINDDILDSLVSILKQTGHNEKFVKILCSFCSVKGCAVSSMQNRL